ncbi:hypothetical protein [Cupriavidus cauae]|uniref:Uncharacterized protein n=1 Tax=Cupriavidus cauae TaxID=2608999 RepID=A0A5M8BHR2_9BURK|nr:hypothetical protein [Cupriavidus cauae]KAA6133270.1 hypothetical protein F1599_01225 [Cupriavidus cauae]
MVVSVLVSAASGAADLVGMLAGVADSLVATIAVNRTSVRFCRTEGVVAIDGRRGNPWHDHRDDRDHRDQRDHHDRNHHHRQSNRRNHTADKAGQGRP